MTLRVILAGNGLGGRAALELLAIEPGVEILAVAPPPGTVPSWQGSFAVDARRLEIPTIEPDNINDPDAISTLAAFAPDLLLSVYYTQIFRKPLMDAISTAPIVNVHPSLLPHYRGTAPLIWALANGEHTVGVTVHRVDSGIDTGPIIDQQTIPVHRTDTGFQLHQKAAHLAQAMVARLVRAALQTGEIPPGVPQSSRGSYYSSQSARLNHINWEYSASRISNIVRALAPPLPGAYTLTPAGPVIVTCAEQAPPTGSGPPGTLIVPEIGRPPVVVTGNGCLRILEFLDGTTLRAGQDFPKCAGLADGDLLG